jgi:hypothetical protein
MHSLQHPIDKTEAQVLSASTGLLDKRCFSVSNSDDGSGAKQRGIYEDFDRMALLSQTPCSRWGGSTDTGSELRESYGNPLLDIKQLYDM